MLRASGFGRGFPAPWAGRRQSGGKKILFGGRSVRLAAATALAALVLVNGFLVLRLMASDDGASVTRQPAAPGREDGAASFNEVRAAFHDVQVAMRADVEGLSLDGRMQGRESNGKPRETSGTEGGPATVSSSSGSGSTSGSTSTGSGSGGSTSAGSDTTDSGSGGGSSGGSGGGEPAGEDTSGGGPGGGGGSDGGGGDAGDGTGGGSGGGGGGG